jgi:hypothetical protein
MSQPRWLGDEKPPTRERSRTQPNERTIDVSIKCPSADRVQGRPSSATEAVECSGREGADTRRSPTNHEWKSKIERIGVLLFFSYGLGAARPGERPSESHPRAVWTPLRSVTSSLQVCAPKRRGPADAPRLRHDNPALTRAA